MSQRKFYRTIVQIEILSETPYSSTDLEKINDDITNGAQVGAVTVEVDSEEMNATTCVKKLKEVGSEPGFFMLDEKGNDLEDEGEEENDFDGGHKIRKMKD